MISAMCYSPGAILLRGIIIMQPHDADPLLRWREQFPILATCTYLISNSLGAMPRAVYDKLHAYADDWATLGVRAWGAGWWELKRQVGDLVAPLIGAPAGSVLMQENASIANAIFISALDWSDTRRDKIIVTDLDFPSDVYSLRAMLPSHVRVEVIKSADGISIDTDALLTAIDERTRLVATSHVLFRSAYIMPAAEITARAHAVGAQVLMNGYHSVGVIPVDVTRTNIDYYIGGTLKWLCGGPGGIFMYARPDLLPKLTPRITGWFAHHHPFAFDLDLELRDDIYRLANGTPAIASLYAVQPGIDVIRAVGVDAIRAKSIRQTQHILDLADAQGYETFSPRSADARGGTITVRPPNAYEVSRELIKRNYVIDYREGAGIRIAPHFYTSDAEIDSVMQEIGVILADGSWAAHTQRSFVT
jgi:kynureninase